jgi:hypothetical protein
MKWFFKWFANKCRESEYSNNTVLRASSTLDYTIDGGLNIQVKQAVGGKIVQFRTYDEKRDSHSTSTYVVHNDEDFSTALSKLITMESLKL